MPRESITIDRYTYRLISGDHGPDAEIHLYDERSNLVATIFGMPGDGPLPAAEEQGARVLLYCRRAVIPELVDMLRSEGPLHLVWLDGMEPALATAFEPVGEAELPSTRRRKR